MNNLPDIRKFYKPLQPSVKDSNEGVHYTEVFPDARSSSFIYCYWQLKSDRELCSPFSYRVVADGCVDIFFNQNNPDENYVMGFSTSFAEFSLAKIFNYTGIRFLPSAFPLLFNLNASELTNQFANLKHVIPKLSCRLSQIFLQTTSLVKIKSLLDHYFLQTLERTDLHIDGRFFEAIELILQSKGTLNIEKNISRGISQRQLRRLFDFYIGSNPKSFSRVVRFQNFLNVGYSAKCLRKDKMFLDAGYYDQSHFIKDFKSMSGLTPAKAFAE